MSSLKLAHIDYAIVSCSIYSLLLKRNCFCKQLILHDFGHILPIATAFKITGTIVSTSTLCRLLASHGFTRKKYNILLYNGG